MDIQFLQNGTPHTLFLSGMHGDEYESGEIFKKLVKKYSDYLYIPEVSPSAVLAKTRKNKFHHDINRAFTDNTDDPEAQELMNFIKNYHFRLSIDIHEDPDRTSTFYMYDSGLLNDKQIFYDIMKKTRINLYSGIDDFEDEHLMLSVRNGYISLPPKKLENENGFFIHWAIAHNIVGRGFTLEIPGKAHPGIKQNILKEIIPFLLTV